VFLQPMHINWLGITAIGLKSGRTSLFDVLEIGHILAQQQHLADPHHCLLPPMVIILVR
jgi:hypothetical protein